MGGKWLISVGVLASMTGCATDQVGPAELSTVTAGLSVLPGPEVRARVPTESNWRSEMPERGMDREPPSLHRGGDIPSTWMRMDLSSALNKEAILCKEAADGALACNDGNPCTIEDCDDKIGCVYQLVKNGTACNDGSVCTLQEECAFGKCSGVKFLCDDGNVCTYDGCKEDGSCHPKALTGTTCKDGDLCNSWDTCMQGTCKGIPKNCDDGDPTTLDWCNPEDGLCVNATAT